MVANLVLKQNGSREDILEAGEVGAYDVNDAYTEDET